MSILTETQVTRNAIRVAVICEERLVGQALCGILRADDAIRVVLDAVRIEAAMLAQQHLDLIIVDVDGDAIEFESELMLLRSELPDVRLLAISKRVNRESLERCATHVQGYFVKGSTPGELIAAVKAVARGDMYVDPHIAGCVLLRRRIARDYASELSEREREVLRLVANGLINREIGERLSVSPKTVKNHVSNIFAKLNLTSRTQAAVHALRIGLI